LKFLNPSTAQYSPFIRLAIFFILLLVGWLPFVLPTYWFWGAGNTTTIVTLLILYLEFIALLIFWGKQVHQQPYPLRSHGLVSNQPNRVEFLGGLGMGFTILMSLFVIEGWLGWLTWQAFPTTFPKLFLEGLLISVGLSFAEELLFRGWLVDELAWNYPFSTALWISSSLYAILHFIKPWSEIVRSLPSFPGLLLLGLMLGWARQTRQQRLGLAIGLHAGMVWGYYLIDVGDWVVYTGQVPDWVTGISQNPLAGAMGLLLLGGIAIALRSTQHS